MKSSRTLLLIFLLPVILVIALAVLINYLSIHSIKQQFEAGNDLQFKNNKVLIEAAYLSEQITITHINLESSLKAAMAGRISPEKLYRVHANAVNSLNKMSDRVKALSQTLQMDDSSTADAHGLYEHFEKYRHFVIQTTDISSINPNDAKRLVAQAQDQYNDFSSHAFRISALLAAHTQSLSKNEKKLFESAFDRVTLIGSAGMIGILLLSAFTARMISKNIIAIASALSDLSDATNISPKLQKMEQLYLNSTGEFKNMAATLLGFRDAIKLRAEAEKKLRDS